MLPDMVRDSPFGLFMHTVSRGKLFRHPEEQPGYVVPSRYLRHSGDDGDRISSRSSDSTLGNTNRPSVDAATLVGVDQPVKRKSRTEQEKRDREEWTGEKGQQRERDLEAADDENEEEQERRKKERKNHPGTADPERAYKEDMIDKYQYLVDFEENDPGNPLNWSPWKKHFAAFQIAMMTTVVYIGSAIYTPSEPNLGQVYGVSETVTVLGLTLFILGYGTGPMFFSPLQETPHLGRNPVYWAALCLFVLLQIPILLPTNLTCIFIFRFLTGFFGSPILATGGASMGDLYVPRQLPYAMGGWAVGAVLGPIMGPVVAAFAVQANGWKWSILELVWMSGFGLLFFTFLLPETYAPTLLFRRAKRLRALTGNELLKTRWELENPHGVSLVKVGTKQISLAFRLAVEPAIGYANLYIGLIYAVFYLWFEAFPIVFAEYHGFNLGLSVLPFLGFLVTGAFTLLGYCLYHKYYFIPKQDRENWQTPPEQRLKLALIATPMIPISLFIFGWTGNSPSTHWIGPTIGAALYFPGVFCAFQCILLYLQQGYPAVTASILAGNDLFRSCMAAGFPLFGRAFFTNLGVGPASSLLAGLNIVFIIPLWGLYLYGDRLRKRSKFGQD
ncbi:benomyl methotrexate resistance protein [Rhodotorula toruloides]|uniref:Benomyl methotrexate resistance protein n=1 Tax=Rhodotorula toruloides TaxID=5286 RepID=A0A511KBK9_RHOTO|nr:benomyl methotrexate resistance protein [Rhodotorula toruloides]